MVAIVKTLEKKEYDHRVEDKIVANIVKIIIPGGFEDILWWDFIVESLNDMRLPKSLIWNEFKPFQVLEKTTPFTFSFCHCHRAFKISMKQLKVTNGSPSNCLEMGHKFRICFSSMTFFSFIKQT
ncbi:hypothetical protein ES319_D11G327300v1 [Gossypium barbadense]|uniref:Uncharacterized protein n=1 Tax=Gossypium barbadense TaxID=3634 RepID=A0A5J5PIC2_GOSBA|nr:hypothetical protein ES319_D11G327300v1 [Gossypium barbadense]